MHVIRIIEAAFKSVKEKHYSIIFVKLTMVTIITNANYTCCLQLKVALLQVIDLT